MENEKEKNYFILWFYISILLHVLVVIIMLTIKPTNSSKEPDPANGNFDATQVIFLQDEQEINNQQTQEDSIPQSYQMAKREQGGSVALSHTQMDPKDAQQDIPAPALSDDYKKALQNQTSINDQDEQGLVNILPDAILSQEEQIKEQILEKIEHLRKEIDEIDIPENSSPIELSQDFQTKTKQLTPGDLLKTVIQEKMHQAEIAKLHEKETQDDLLQPEIQKVVSKKHRPADVGQENLSKVQLSKPVQDTPLPKKKLSLQDLQNGFSQFIRNGTTIQTNSTPTASVLGNSLFFSSEGNSDKDDITGLKLASYMHQTGQMYQNSTLEFVDAVRGVIQREGLPTENNYVAITIERSGKISQAIVTQSCGNSNIDNLHIKAIQSIGTFPPIPKYINAPLQVYAYLPFKNSKLRTHR